MYVHPNRIGSRQLHKEREDGDMREKGICGSGYEPVHESVCIVHKFFLS